MEEKNKNQQNDRLEEQQAPLKNTDQAFVQVGHDGHPVTPERSSNEKGQKDDLREGNSSTTLKHR